jgi:mannitol/fructose-specific phosphotransferase system IIA component (Ntr-type)
MDLRSALKPGTAFVEEGPSTLDAVLERLARLAGPVLNMEPGTLQAALGAREAVQSTTFAAHVAVPHAVIDTIPTTLVVPGLVRQGVNGTHSKHAVYVIIGMFGCSKRPWDHIRLLARIARIAEDPAAVERLRAATSHDDLIERLRAEDAAHA